MTRKIVVSGTASGIGRSLADLLRAQGDEVIGVDLRDAEVCADLATAQGRARAVEAALDLCGGVLDGVVACAGVAGFVPLTIRVNFFGATALLDGLRPALARAAAPRAAVVGSISGTQPADQGVIDACLAGDERAALTLAELAEGHRLYPSSKAALARWLRRAAITPEWAGAGIPLNAIAPGVVRTPMTEPLFADAGMVEVMEQAVPMPLGGPAEAGTIAEALRWLIAPANTHMTGQVIYLDGGAETVLRGPEVF